MKLTNALLHDPQYKHARSLCESISDHRFKLAELAAELKAENYIVWNKYELENGIKTSKAIYWSELIALAGGVEIRTAQEWAQVGEWIAANEPKTKVYSRVSAVLRYIGTLSNADMLEIVDDEETYHTVESVRRAFDQIAYGKTEYDTRRIIQALIRIKSGSEKLLGLNGDLDAEIRADVEAGTRHFANALQTMEWKGKRNDYIQEG